MMSSEILMGQHMMLAFPGKGTVPPEHEQILRSVKPAGYTLFRHLNIDNPEQVLSLARTLQDLASDAGIPPLFIATDQEGGQLMSIGEGVTQLPGNMAIGATNSEDLAYQAGIVLGREMAALGINVIYAPVCDVNINPNNPVIGIRSFSEDPDKVAALSAAMIRGIQSIGIIATAKHFPGHGDTSGDSHYGITRLPYGSKRLNEIEFKPFRSAIHTGVKMMMTAHLSLPVIEGQEGIPATLSKKIITEQLRNTLNYDGVIITDAMDMKAIAQGDNLGNEAVKAIAAGVDLLLLTGNLQDQKNVYHSLSNACQERKLDAKSIQLSDIRIRKLKENLLSIEKVDLSILNCTSHQSIANQIASRAITLVRDDQHQIPFRPEPDDRIAVIMPETDDLTPADTSSYLRTSLAGAIRNHHDCVDEIKISHYPDDQEIDRVLSLIQTSKHIIIGTINACSNPSQTALVKQVLASGKPVIIVSLRLPYDLVEFPDAPCYLCTYGLLDPSLQAVAKAIFGKKPITGKLPVTIPGIASAGFGIELQNK